MEMYTSNLNNNIFNMELLTALPKFTFLSLLIKKPTLLIATSIPIVTPIVIEPTIISFSSVAWILFWMVIVDQITGLAAAYYTWKDSPHEEKWFFGRGGKGEGFSSEIFNRMLLFKGAIYIGLPYMIINLQQTMALKTVKYTKFTDSEFEYATIILLFFCANEGFSIFHENLPKCGFDLWGIVKKMFGFYKEVKKEISE